MILAIVDAYSRFLIAKPVKSTAIGHARAVLEEVFDTFGNPKRIKTDNGPPFNGSEWPNAMSERGVETVFSTPCDPQQNGGIETYMRLINKGMTAPSVENSNWKRSLADTVAAHNASVCEATGMAPEELLFGRKICRYLPLPEEEKSQTDERIREKDWAAKMKAKIRDDAKRGAREPAIEIGDDVYILRQSKSKGETRFDSTVFKVIGITNGTLTLRSPIGNILKRTMTFVKKIVGRDQPMDEVSVPISSDAVSPEAGQPSEVQADHNEPRRSTRVKKAPTYFESYVRQLESDGNTGE